MFEEGQYFAPVATEDDGSVVVRLAAGHPGFADQAYRERRNAIAALAIGHTRGDPVPDVVYTAEEHRVWELVSRELKIKHRRYATADYLEGSERLALPADRIPQLQEVGDLLEPLTGFRYLPAAGLVPLRDFYGVLDDGLFHSTQYIRHHSVPFYTPEPDVVHEVIGHANALASDRFASLYRLAGAAARRVETQEALEFVSKVFWFTLEFGVLAEGGEDRAYGAGILSSYGEIEEFRGMDILPLDLAVMGTTGYDITKYQDVLFRAESMSHLEDVVGAFWATCDDDSVARLVAGRAVVRSDV
ncbi:phenylalanine 4-monooxygenase [Sphaerisporangium sp. TRM90804]|uniref:phenylalanine 4-monooxygenase n=1 Tax=Sphaerisporangium sp. TRM90804 TaxID=3031113 RepID=UPI002448D2D4|nr:phenylalanine 4-monooxygenase [Sphaerisporangium sp. TRM90804]MDH2427801.1 phenylalanine 4-monooxygenase [Sphaerisporangium sp. TRM90804]